MATDYPEDVILKNLNTNFEVNCGKQVENGSMKVVGHVWGKDIPKLISEIFRLRALLEMDRNNNL